jgi:molecular chaperone HscB
MQDHFARLGLPRRFSVDLAALESAYLAASREAHPDFHALGTTEQQDASLRDTAAVNEAYLTLKDPFRRADYLLGLLGGPTAGQQKDMPQAFLMEMMDLREQIETVKQSGDERKLDTLEADLGKRYESIFVTVKKLFDTDPSPLPAIRRELNAAKTVRGLLRDLR